MNGQLIAETHSNWKNEAESDHRKRKGASRKEAPFLFSRHLANQQLIFLTTLLF
jgi:hypothetical protein